MTDPKPRPCHHTSMAILGVLLAGLMLGAFSPQPKSLDVPTTHASTKPVVGR